MVEIAEAVVGAAFLSPIAFSAIAFCSLPAEPVIAMAAVLALPLGWLAFTFERFLFTFKGRYEHYPTMEFIRSRAKVEKLDDNAYRIDLGRIIPKDKEDKLSRTLILKEEDFDLLFDPFKSLKQSKILFWKSHRGKQQHSSLKLPYVENIEDMIFFEDQGLADFIRSAIATYHTSLAAVYAFLLGLLFSSGFTLAVNPKVFSEFLTILTQINITQIDFTRLAGVVVCAGVLFVLIWATLKQSRLRRKEAIAHEYLLVRLRVQEKE